MPPKRCIICGAPNSTCGPPTAHRIIPVDARVTGYDVAGDKLVPKSAGVGDVASTLSDLSQEEREEFVVVANQYSRQVGHLRRGVGEGMEENADSTVAPFTSLVYVEDADGITRKMAPDVADRYVAMTEGAKIVRRGSLPVTKEGEILGASKARVGPMFGPDGRQLAETQPITTTTFVPTDATREDVSTPSIGGTGAADAGSAPTPKEPHVTKPE